MVSEKIHKLQRRCWVLSPAELILPTASPENLPQTVQKWFMTNCPFLAGSLLQYRLRVSVLKLEEFCIDTKVYSNQLEYFLCWSSPYDRNEDLNQNQGKCVMLPVVDIFSRRAQRGCCIHSIQAQVLLNVIAVSSGERMVKQRHGYRCG